MTVRLAAVEQGTGPTVAILHGLFGSSRNWATIARHLAEHHRVIALDLRNHGNSPWSGLMDYRELADDVHATLTALGCDRVALLGHSMGGKAAMVEALTHPAAVERLIVADIAPVRYELRHLSHVKALRDLDLSGISRRSEADTRLQAAIPDPAERMFLLQNLLFADDRPRWRINLPAIEQAMPALAGFPAMPPDARYEGPTLFVVGGRSDYVRPEHEPKIRRLFPAARIVAIPDAGHWLHAERPQPFLQLVSGFLASA